MSASIKENPASSLTLGGELETGWDSSERLPKRLESFSILKQKGDDFSKWARAGGVPDINSRKVSKIFRGLDTCGSLLIFRQYHQSGRTRLIGGCTCKMHLLCAFCAARRGVKNTVAYKSKVDSLLVENPAQDLMLLTFTIQNGVDLMERKNHLASSMQKLLKKRNDSMRSTRSIVSEMGKFSGGVFAYEFKRGSGLSLWHPHIHMLALIPKGLRCDVEELKREWFAITGDSSVINIEKCFNDMAFLEVFAYALKFSEMNNFDRWQASQLLKRERLISSFGDFRNVEVDENDMDDLLDSDEPTVDLLFSWCSGRGYSLSISIENDEEAQKTRRENAILRSSCSRNIT